MKLAKVLWLITRRVLPVLYLQFTSVSEQMRCCFELFAECRKTILNSLYMLFYIRILPSINVFSIT